MRKPRCIVVMGVSGCGKSSLGQSLADRLSLPFLEGDSLHPARNVALMASGIALTDEDRQGWLEAIGQKLHAACAQASPDSSNASDENLGLIVSCSALKRRYRDLLRQAVPVDLCFIHLHGSAQVLESRMQQRSGHYMPASLLASQLATLEMPTPDEAVLSVDIELSAQAQLTACLDYLAAGSKT
jgi:gluconokinase